MIIKDLVCHDKDFKFKFDSGFNNEPIKRSQYGKNMLTLSSNPWKSYIACSSFWLNLVRPHELRLNHKMLAEPLPNLGEVTWSLVDFSIKVLQIAPSLAVHLGPTSLGDTRGKDVPDLYMHAYSGLYLLYLWAYANIFLWWLILLYISYISSWGPVYSFMSFVMDLFGLCLLTYLSYPSKSWCIKYRASWAAARWHGG